MIFTQQKYTCTHKELLYSLGHDSLNVYGRRLAALIVDVDQHVDGDLLGLKVRVERLHTLVMVQRRLVLLLEHEIKAPLIFQ